MFDFLNLSLLGLQDPMRMATMMAEQNIAPMAMQEAMGGIGQMAQPSMAVGGAANMGAMAPGGSLPQPAPPMVNGAGANPINATGPGTQVANLDNGVFDEFMGAVKNGGLVNPHGLAAVAATGMRETRFSAGNAFREWDDVGKPAGGVMSWRDGRLTNLKNFGGGDLKAISPGQQGQFFLQEDPSLIAKLNAAGSSQEAMSLMNNAWAFKGFNDPNHPEFKARMAAVDKIAPLFAEGGSMGMSVESATAANEMNEENRRSILASLGGEPGAGGTVTGTSGTAQAIPPKPQTLADKLAAMGKGLKVPEAPPPQEPPRIAGGLAPDVGGGFGRDPGSIEKLFALLGGNVPAQSQVPSLAALIKGVQ